MMRTLAWIALVCTVAAPAVALAETEAEKAEKAGYEAFTKKQYDLAYGLFERAFALEPTPRRALYLTQAQINRAHHAIDESVSLFKKWATTQDGKEADWAHIKIVVGALQQSATLVVERNDRLEKENADLRVRLAQKEREVQEWAAWGKKAHVEWGKVKRELDALRKLNPKMQLPDGSESRFPELPR